MQSPAHMNHYSYLAQSLAKKAPERSRPNLMVAMSNFLEYLCTSNRGIATGSPFDGTFPCRVNYLLDRLRRHCGCGDEIFLCMLLLINDLTVDHRVVVTYRSVHRLVLAATLIAVKMREDFYNSNSHFAAVGGITVQEMNKVEGALLNSLEWELAQAPSSYHELYTILTRDWSVMPRGGPVFPEVKRVVEAPPSVEEEESWSDEPLPSTPREQLSGSGSSTREQLSTSGSSS
ncbi:Cyclin-U3-1 [Diplonema papillatum]|nr:Cyclin-U3-1 [Diplonema papillatum]